MLFLHPVLAGFGIIFLFLCWTCRILIISSYIIKSLDCTAPFKSTERCKSTKLEKEELAKQLVIRKATVPNAIKFGNIFNEQFDTIVYSFVDTVCTVFAGINLVISEAAC